MVTDTFWYLSSESYQYIRIYTDILEALVNIQMFRFVCQQGC